MHLRPYNPLGGLMRICLLALLCSLGPTAHALAQKLDAIPEAPAFTFLNVTPAEVSRPITPRALSTALVNAVGEDGRVRQGFALDAAPWSWIPGLAINLTDYQSDRGKYALANTQLSLATVRASGESASTDLSVGTRVTVLDYGDPMREPGFTDELRAELERRCPLPDQPGEVQAADPLECTRDVTRILREQWADEHWNGYSLALAAAAGWRLDQSHIVDAGLLGWSAWITGSAPLDEWGQVLAQARYQRRDELADLRMERDWLTIGIRLLVGSRDVNAFAEAVRTLALGDATGGNESQWSGGLELRVAEGMWLATGFGSGENLVEDDNPLVVIANLRWELRDRPRLQPE